ncbi:HpcH/HpaI aldolase/citrate lyase family protein [Burkholderia ubonensis]|uniref:HpcH/HpaI aldolase/citrate lyase family protein n=1 Tax=Burkholderia ubonensis TaxID=101571 RepID=UPI000752C9F6|nr:CoA ester lyase [Burkholderia ubonensis]KWC17011.1 aldolase [Burkholderia ubonensis]KWC42317.1 aldolase [Burkholderia ubonensis]KWF06604.1 aldolase [Burkholderia ubonensis]
MPSRSWLFVPGNRPDRFAKAMQSGADVVVIDLEDAVPSDKKAVARAEIQQWLSPAARAVHVRINANESPWFDEDVAAFASDERVCGLVIPKVECADAIRRAVGNAHPALRVVPIIETGRAFASLNEIARAPHVDRLMFGTIDFQLDVGIEGDGDELLYFRSKLVLASRVAGIAPPIDGVVTSINDAGVLERDARRARSLGFRGKACIHPAQIRAVHAGFAYSEAEMEWAHRVVGAARASGGEAIVVDGRMVDKPIVLKAIEIAAASSQ